MVSIPMTPAGKNFNGPDEGERTIVPTGVTLRTLLVGDNMVMVEARWPKGTVGTIHSHEDHESMGYLISGKMRLEIGGETFEIEPGASWIHPAGVVHQGEALEDSIHIEVKAPARRTW